MRFIIGFFVGLTLGYGIASLLTMPGEGNLTDAHKPAY
jgi:hypothetical protein